MRQVLDEANHFGHRENGGLVVDLFWTHGDLRDEFRVEIEDKHMGVRLFLYPTTGREAIQAFHHPFATATSLDGEARAA